jgi:hypothetical protein
MFERGPARALCLIALCAAALGILTCGRKTPVRPPTMVAPETIDGVTASNAPDGVHLSWPRPAKRADGTRMSDLGGFRVQRGLGDAPAVTIATVVVTDRDRIQQERHFAWLDTDVSVGATYRYYVLSFTTDDYVSRPSNIVTITRAIPTATPPPTPTTRPNTPTPLR